MAENGNLLMFETEGDTVVNAFSSDYGDHSDAFRKAFAHESFGYLSRGDDGEEMGGFLGMLYLQRLTTCNPCRESFY